MLRVVFAVDMVPFVELLRLERNGGGGVSGNVGEEGVAFSIRAQVR